MTNFDYTVIGAGIVGLATALRLVQRYPESTIAVVDKESGPARHQSGHNSGVIHAGVYYEPGSAKATLCRRGLASTIAFCEDNDIPFRRCGKLVVATDALEHDRLRRLHERARTNGVDCDLISATELHRLEPAIRGLAALKVHESGIVDYVSVAGKMAAKLTADGVTLRFDSCVRTIDETRDEVRVGTDSGELATRRLIVCAGLQSDRMVELAGIPRTFSIVPFRGDFYHLAPARSEITRHLIYPVPDPALPFLGVHLTPTMSGSMTVGPSAMLALHREGYSKTAVSWRDVASITGFPGAWRLFARYFKAGSIECLHALSKHAYLRAVQKYCPELGLDDLRGYACGVRAQAVSRNGHLINDFLIERTPRSVHVCNAPSPAATAAIPIADHIIDEIAAD